ncbi:MAG: hypothetical protein ABW178_07205 [Pseudoxanthomonas sp.]
MPVQLSKTALAHTTLQTHRTALDLRQRRALILADGQRSAVELAGLLGPGGAQLLEHLMQAGYLASASTVAAPAIASPAQAVPTATVQGVNPTATSPRRSLAAARMYLLGMLELQRTPLAAGLRQRLQLATDDHAIVAALGQALDALPAMTSDGYADRVRQRTREVVPQHWLAWLDAGATA